MTSVQRPERPFRTIPLGESMWYRAEYGTGIPVTDDAGDETEGDN